MNGDKISNVGRYPSPSNCQAYSACFLLIAIDESIDRIARSKCFYLCSKE